jgi:CubicO group peptidase (beta-lactamase class C family)
MWIASCTKVMTAISCMQLVERGLLNLDEPVYRLLPELKDLPVLSGFEDDGKPIVAPHKTPLTLRHLLTHTSGFSYDGDDPKLLAWNGTKYSRAGTVAERFRYPLLFEPGSSWIYGCGIDWAGLMVERANEEKLSLNDWMSKYIWAPVGAKDLTFYLPDRIDLFERLCDMSKRDQNNKKKVKRSNADLGFLDREKKYVKGCMGGQGVFASPEAYFRVILGLLRAEDDEVFLKKSSLEELFRPQLPEGPKKVMNEYLRLEEVNNAMGGTPMSIQKDWGLGGMIVCDDVEGGYTNGAMTWGGLPNLTWVSLATTASLVYTTTD